MLLPKSLSYAVFPIHYLFIYNFDRIYQNLGSIQTDEAVDYVKSLTYCPSYYNYSQKSLLLWKSTKKQFFFFFVISTYVLKNVIDSTSKGYQNWFKYLELSISLVHIIQKEEKRKKIKK